MDPIYYRVPEKFISSAYPNSSFDSFCRICDNFCKGTGSPQRTLRALNFFIR